MSAAGLCIHQQCHPVPFSVVYHTWAGSLDSHTGAWEAWLRLDFHQTSPKCWADRWNQNNYRSLCTNPTSSMHSPGMFLNVGMIFGFFKPETMCQMREVKGFNDDLSNILNSVDDCTPLNENSECLATLTRSGTGDGSNCLARFGKIQHHYARHSKIADVCKCTKQHGNNLFGDTLSA